MSECKLTYYEDVKSKNINWLWYPYIPFGKITIVQGDPGEGKTSFVLSLLSILSIGGNLPCSGITVFGKAIYQNSEDDNSDTIKPRLEMYGADCSNICFIDKPDGNVSLDDNLKDAVEKSNAKIIVLDPIQSFIGENVDINRANAVRSKMNILKDLAGTTGCAVILVGHLNKNSGGKAGYRGLGSIDFSAAARSILAIGRPINNPNIRVMAQQKNNLGPIGESIAFTLKNGKIEWLGKYDITAEELVSSSCPDREMPKTEAANILLSTLLSAGEKSYKEIMYAAFKQGIGKRTLMTVKANLNIASVKRADGWYWKKK